MALSVAAAAWVNGCGGISVREPRDGGPEGGAAAGRLETGGRAARGGSGGHHAGDSGARAGTDDAGFAGSALVARGGANEGGAAVGGDANTSAGAEPFGGAGAAGDAGSGGEPDGGPTPGDAVRHIVATDLNISLDTRIGMATLTLAASSTSGATFEIGDCTIKSVTQDGVALGYSTHAGTLEVDVPASSQETAVTVEYRFNNHQAFDGISGRGYSFTWPYYCGNAFPCHSDPAEASTFKLFVKGGAWIANFPTEIPFPAPAYMAAWAVGNYFPIFPGKTQAGTELEVFYRIDNPTGEADARAGTAHLVQAFDWFEQHLGPYKFGSTVGPIPVQWPDASLDGMEHHPLWHVNETSMSDELVQAHEAAHGWFGNGVRLRCWEDFVLSEGTASYLAARVLEEVGATAVSTAAWDGYRATFTAGWANDAIAAWPDGCGSVDVLASGLFSPMTYVKGALFLKALEESIGRPALDRALSTFYTRWVGQAAGMQDLLDVVYETSGYDAGSCAKAWLERVRPQATICD